MQSDKLYRPSLAVPPPPRLPGFSLTVSNASTPLPQLLPYSTIYTTVITCWATAHHGPYSRWLCLYGASGLCVACGRRGLGSSVICFAGPFHHTSYCTLLRGDTLLAVTPLRSAAAPLSHFFCYFFPDFFFTFLLNPRSYRRCFISRFALRGSFSSPARQAFPRWFLSSSASSHLPEYVLPPGEALHLFSSHPAPRQPFRYLNSSVPSTPASLLILTKF